MTAFSPTAASPTAAPGASGAAGPPTYTLMGQTGSFTLVGDGASVGDGHRQDVMPGVFTLSGGSSAMAAGYPLPASPGSFALAGGDTTFARPRRGFGTSPGNFGITGQVTLDDNRVLIPETGAFALTGIDQSFIDGYFMGEATGSFALQGGASSLRVQKGLTLSREGIFRVAGVANKVRQNHRMPAAAGSYALTAAHANSSSGYTMGAMPGSFAVTRPEGVLQARCRIMAWPTVFALAAPDLASSVARTMMLESGTFSITGRLGFSRGYVPALPVTTVPLTGYEADLARRYTMTAEAGAIHLTGDGVTPGQGRRLGLAPGAFALAGRPVKADLRRVLSLQPGSIVLGGQADALKRTRRVPCSPGVFTLQGGAGIMVRTGVLGGLLNQVTGLVTTTITVAGTTVSTTATVSTLGSADAHPLGSVPVADR